MDGVLIDSEGFWQDAEIEVFAKEGANITREMCQSMAGVKCEHIMQAWKEKFPFLKHSVEYYLEQVFEILHHQITTFGKAMEGVMEILEFLKQKNIKIALASSSRYHQIDDVLDTLKIREYFSVIHSSEEEKFGKPSPDVFLSAAKKLGANPSDCIVIEDSINGVKAGKNANMKVVAVPSKEEFSKKEFDIADYKLKSLKDFLMIEEFKNLV